MKPFLTEHFLLTNRTAVRLYREYAEHQPIIDYHCHLPVREIAENRIFDNLTKIWLYGDHYKWRAMRANGVDERFVTGDASDREKFQAWAETVPRTLGNPLYHWTHLELKRPFGVKGVLLNGTTAGKVWKACNEKLKSAKFSARGILKQMNVKCLCTTDDPTDGLEYHRAIASDKSFEIVVLPTFRPDKGMSLENHGTFRDWLRKLEETADMDIGTFDEYLAALGRRHDFFHENGCRLSDHGIETAYAEDYSGVEIASTFSKARAGQRLSPSEIVKFKSAMLYEFGIMDHEKGWTQQYHLGALRNVNSRMFRVLGPDTGFDTIGDFEIARPLARMLARLDDRNRLAKTILYNLNPGDNALMAAMVGNFQDGTSAGKIQYGSAWWFLDQKSGIEQQLDALARMGLLSRFVGMLTDSRSFLSYPRHEYFRRILCNMLGEQIEQGLLPNDMRLVGGMVADICFRNAKAYFGFPGV